MERSKYNAINYAKFNRKVNLLGAEKEAFSDVLNLKAAVQK